MATNEEHLAAQKTCKQAIEELERVKPIMRFHDVLGWENLIQAVTELIELCYHMLLSFGWIDKECTIRQSTIQDKRLMVWNEMFFKATGRKVHP